jgi:hypothetical protein
MISFVHSCLPRRSSKKWCRSDFLKEESVVVKWTYWCTFKKRRTRQKVVVGILSLASWAREESYCVRHWWLCLVSSIMTVVSTVLVVSGQWSCKKDERGDWEETYMDTSWWWMMMMWREFISFLFIKYEGTGEGLLEQFQSFQHRILP